MLSMSGETALGQTSLILASPQMPDGKSPRATNPDPDADLRLALHRLISLLEDPHPGLAAWCDARERARNDILRELRRVVP